MKNNQDASTMFGMFFTLPYQGKAAKGRNIAMSAPRMWLAKAIGRDGSSKVGVQVGDAGRTGERNIIA